MPSTKTNIIIAIVLGAMLVGGAFYMNLQQVTAEVANESAITSITRKHIPITDTDEDGVPDWQELVIDSDPIMIDESTSTKPFKAPQTITEQLSYDLAQDQRIVDGSPMYELTKEYIAQDYVNELKEVTKETLYTEDDLTIITTVSKARLREYGNTVAGIIYYGQEIEDTEEKLFARYTKDKNPKHLEKLAAIEAEYVAIIAELLALEVPENYTFEHLAIVNALSALEKDADALQAYDTDPMYTLMRYSRYYDDVLGVSNGIINLYDALYLDEKIEFLPNDSLRYLAERLR